MRVPIPNSEEYLLLRELTHRMNNEFASAAYCRRWLGLASIFRRRAIASFATYLAIGARARQARQYCQKHSRSCAFTKLVCDSDAGESGQCRGCEMCVAGLRA